jgi:predicted membrane GTPase involved in stress response
VRFPLHIWTSLTAALQNQPEDESDNLIPLFSSSILFHLLLESRKKALAAASHDALDYSRYLGRIVIGRNQPMGRSKLGSSTPRQKTAKSSKVKSQAHGFEGLKLQLISNPVALETRALWLDFYGAILVKLSPVPTI